ncbi:hypothetical protein [Gordonia sp. CPCC 205333]|uniref:hypothetical protein n=1 Tax=Gordonia sp. CPCC 205333 TaxID=3140790 RepID=UPI003AF3A33B
MTLTTILPTLRASIPDPIDLKRWPAGTRATVSDIVIDGQSASSVAGQRGTPCVFDAGEVFPWAGDHDARGVVIVRVLAVGCVDESMPSYARSELILDAEPGRVAADWHEVRMIHRVSTAKVGVFSLAGREPVVVDLPVDIGVGDLLIAPCAL